MGVQNGVIKKNDLFFNPNLFKRLLEANSSLNMIHLSGRYSDLFIWCQLVWICLHTVRSKSKKRVFSIWVPIWVWKPQQVSFEDHWTESNHRIWDDHTILSIGWGLLGLEGSNGVRNDGLRSEKLTGSLIKNAFISIKKPHSKQFACGKLVKQGIPI